MVFLCCDAGSTKTEFLLASDKQGLLATKRFPACNYLELGETGFSENMQVWIKEICCTGGIPPDQLTFSVFGLPALGEVEGLEQGAAKALGRFVSSENMLLCNDAVLGWAGSLEGKAGIHVVSGTGSIVYGENEQGISKRVGGWSLLCDDPGSSAWVGRQALSLFFRQVDGREPRSSLYTVFCEHWGLGEHPEYFVGKALPTLNISRTELARVQLLARKAAEAGDQAVKCIYDQAVDLLAEQVRVVRDSLHFHSACQVSYSGGFFQNGDRVLQPFKAKLDALNMILVPPTYSPILGALALGARRFLAPEALTMFLKRTQEVMKFSS